MRDDVKQATRIEWSGESADDPVTTRRERLTYELADARPEAAAVRGAVEQEVKLPGRTLL